MKIYQDENYSFKERAADLVSRMTLEEKISQLGNLGAAIPRLGVPFYNYWSEASHGYFGPFKYRPMDVTSFPVCLAMSQSWDQEKIRKVTTAISDECRAYNNADGDELHMWCPTINMARDPRNGRSDENFGEDPYLAGKLAVSYIQGMQGEDDTYVKVIATPKHYALNSSENNRHHGSSNVDEATMREYYAKAFEYAIREGKAESIMTSYNRINGVPASCNDFLLTTLLREEWGFDGMVVSDCGAVGDVWGGKSMNADGKSVKGHFYAKNMKEASAMTLEAGCDMSCGAEHKYNLKEAVKEGMIKEQVIDRALIRIFTSRFRLGLFDQKEHVPYSGITMDAVCSKEHAALSEEMANDTIVLLKNERNLLPLDKNEGKTILVVGPNAIYRELGGYSAGSISKVVETPVNIMALDGIKAACEGTDTKVLFEKGWNSGREFKENAMELLPGAEIPDASDTGFSQEDIMAGIADTLGPDVTMEKIGLAFMSPERHIPEDPDKKADPDVLFARALSAAKEADYVVVIAGTDATNASEEHDRESLALPYDQDEKIQKLLEANENTIVVLSTLGAVTGEFFDHAHTILNAHFAGESQGSAIANVIFGTVNPNAKLTATWYKDVRNLPHVNDYGLRAADTFDGKTRTYMYHEDEVLFPFGYGLSYTEYAYSGMKISDCAPDANDTIEISCTVENKGDTDGAEIVQLYVTSLGDASGEKKTADSRPLRQLKGFKKVFLKAGESEKVTFSLKISELAFWSNRQKKMAVDEGRYMVQIGKSSAEIVLCEQIQVRGSWNPKLASVYVQAEDWILQKGQKTRLLTVATLEDTKKLKADTYKITYQSTNPQILEVDEAGEILAKNPGAATVIVRVSYQENTMEERLAIAVKENEVENEEA